MPLEGTCITPGRVFVGPAGAPLPTGADSLEGFEPVGWIEEGSLAVERHAGAPASWTVIDETFTLRLSGLRQRRLWRKILGLPYQHPRQILHKGKKPR